MRVLLAEDELVSSRKLVSMVRSWGYETLLVNDGTKAWDVLQQPDTPRLAVLDWMMPGLDGPEVCRRLRQREEPYVYVLLLTSRGEKEDVVVGLDAGADDYVTKPFSVRELLARVRARLRATTAPPSDVVRMGDAEVDFVAHVLRRGGAEVALTKTELGMLRVFARNPGVVLPRARFLDEVWGLRSFPTTRTVDMHVLRLREKLGDVGDEPRHLRTVHGVGYRYDP